MHTLRGERIAELFAELKHATRFEWVLPNRALQACRQSPALSIQNAAQPVSVKKQCKYNVTRWGISGRNDLWLNSLCYRRYESLNRKMQATDEEWRSLCRMWASDFRTHITDQRYRELLNSLGPNSAIDKEINQKFSIQSLGTDTAGEFTVTEDIDRDRLSVTGSEISVTFDAKRGLAVNSLAFRVHDFKPIIGTLAHGYFDDIRFSADYFSNHLVVERFKERDRVTDLNAIRYEVTEHRGCLEIRCAQDTLLGPLEKWYKISGDKIECGFEFCNEERPEASLRLGYMTLLDSRQRCWYATHNGGSNMEYFQAADDFDHGSPVSSIVSANTALGATEGKLYFGNGSMGVELNWSPGCCAAMPMILSRKIGARYFNRLWFSLVESDETLKSGGTMMDFSYQISPCHRSQLERADPCAWSRSSAHA